MTEKIVDFPFSYLPRPSRWGQFQNSINTNQQRLFVPGQHARIQDFFCQGERGPGSSTYFTVYVGGPIVLLHIFQGGPTFSGGGGGGGGSKC